MNECSFSCCHFQVYVVVGIAGVFLTGCVLMVIILKYGRSSKFGIKGDEMLKYCLRLALA